MANAKDAKVFVGFYLPRELDRRLEYAAVELDTSKSRLVELGVRLVLAVLGNGYVPDDLGYVLQERDAEVLEGLQQLLARRAEARQG